MHMNNAKLEQSKDQSEANTPKQVVLTHSFMKSFIKLAKSEENADKINEILDVSLNQNIYLKHWRKLTHIAFNKRDTLRLAKNLRSVKPELSLYQAKLIISKLKWWEYEYFIELIEMFDKDGTKKIRQTLEYLSDFGKTHHEKMQTEEFNRQLDAKWEDMLQQAKMGENQSILLSPEQDKGKYPLLEWTHEELELARRETKEENKKLAEQLTHCLKDNLRYKSLFVTYLDVWSHSYAKKAFNANYASVARQIKQAKHDLQAEKWQSLTGDLLSFRDWWD